MHELPTTVAICMAVLTAAALPPETASANAAAPHTYIVHEEERPIRICPWNFADSGCHTDETLLRENVETGRTVVIPSDECRKGDRCGEIHTWTSQKEYGVPDNPRERCCYVDRCVPPGTYRYGYADPYQCHSASAGTEFYTQVTVQKTPDGCRSTPKQSWDRPVPWKDKPREICDYGESPNGSEDVDTDNTELEIRDVDVPTAPDDGADSDDSARRQLDPTPRRRPTRRPKPDRFDRSTIALAANALILFVGFVARRDPRK